MGSHSKCEPICHCICSTQVRPSSHGPCHMREWWVAYSGKSSINRQVETPTAVGTVCLE